MIIRYHHSRYQRLVYPRFERCIVVAPRDAEAVRNTVPGVKVGVIPNGIDTQYFRPSNESPDTGVLVFHGNLSYPPNIEAAVAFADDILPRIREEEPRVRFHVVGAKPPTRIQSLATRPGLLLSADVPDVRSIVASASIYVCAIRHGTGVKNKILEAMAMGVPVVSYPEAILGIDATAGRDVVVASDSRDFAACVVSLLRMPERARSIARAARKLVERNYSWDSRARAFEQAYRDAIADRSLTLGSTARV
jgi:glycosyltransferase involved in cell wall biosynthesis